MSSKLADTVDCGFVLWSHEIEMTVQYYVNKVNTNNYTFLNIV